MINNLNLRNILNPCTSLQRSLGDKIFRNHMIGRDLKNTLFLPLDTLRIWIRMKLGPHSSVARSPCKKLESGEKIAIHIDVSFCLISFPRQICSDL